MTINSRPPFDFLPPDDFLDWPPEPPSHHSANAAFANHPLPWQVVRRGEHAEVFCALGRRILVTAEPAIADLVVERVNAAVPGGRQVF